MEIYIDLSRKDYAEFNRYYFFRKKNKINIYIILFISIIIPFFIKDEHPFNIKIHLLMTLISIVVFGVLFLLFMALIVKLSEKLPKENGAIIGKRKFIITDEGLVEESESNRNIQKWKSINSIEENKNYVFVFIDSMIAYVIPKRFFKDEEEQSLFINTLNEKLKI